MKVVLFRYVILDQLAVGLVKIRQHFEQLFIGFINSSNQIAHFVFFEILCKCLQAMLHELIYLNRVVVLVITVDC